MQRAEARLSEVLADLRAASYAGGEQGVGPRREAVVQAAEHAGRAGEAARRASATLADNRDR